jgi:hypothetical protein
MKLITIPLNLIAGVVLYFIALDYLETWTASLGAAALGPGMIILVLTPVLSVCMGLLLSGIQGHMLHNFYMNTKLFWIVSGLTVLVIAVLGIASRSEFPLSFMKSEPLYTSFQILTISATLSFGLTALQIVWDVYKAKRKNSL